MKYLVDLDDNEKLTEINWMVLSRMALPSVLFYSSLSIKFEMKLMQLTIKFLLIKYYEIRNDHFNVNMEICAPAMINIHKNTQRFLSVNLLLSSESARYFAQLCLNNLPSIWLKQFWCCLGTFDKNYEKISVATSF